VKFGVSFNKLPKTIASLLGTVIGIAGIFYLIDFLGRVDFLGHIRGLDASKVLTISLLIGVFALANSLIAVGWRWIIKDFGGELSLARANLIFCQSNLLKYVPGNILHIAGQQVLAMRAGVPGLITAKSITMEMILLVVTSASFAANLWLATRYTADSFLISAMILPIFFAFVLLILKHLGYPGSAKAALAFCLYHFVGGATFSSLFFVLGTVPDRTWFFTFSASYIASWILGLITPGAPAGLGVREASLIALLQGSVTDQPALAAAVVLVRGMTITSDGLYFLVVRFFSMKESKTCAKKG
jgi:uncharacterized membrane protein YbhN (UPF0104 family)